MENNNMKKCPYCAEMIKADAIKCRYCGSNLSKKDSTHDFTGTSDYWRRVNEGKRIAGVCTGIAHQFNAPRIILPLRLFFIISTLFWGFGLILYVVLWILMPGPVKRLERVSAGSSPSVSGGEVNSTEITPDKKASPVDIIISFFLIAIGITLVFGFFFKAHIFPVSIFDYSIKFPHIIHPWFWGEPSWIPVSLLTLLTFFGLIIILIGGLKLIRFFVGCGLVLVGTMFLLIFVPFLPMMLPGLLILGLILIIIGGLKLIF